MNLILRVFGVSSPEYFTFSRAVFVDVGDILFDVVA
jgi:hypothetical protein